MLECFWSFFVFLCVCLFVVCFVCLFCLFVFHLGVLKLSLTNMYAFHERLVTSLEIHICVSCVLKQ